MRKKWLVYIGFFVLLLAGFYIYLGSVTNFYQSSLPVINDNVRPFSFVNQNGKTITEKDVQGKVYVVEFFFTTCKGICPMINANMRRVYDEYKNDSSFMILSHTCMPATDSVPLLKAYEYKMINGKLSKDEDGIYKIEAPTTAGVSVQNTTWDFLTGDKAALYKMAQHSYLIDNNKSNADLKIQDQFIHTQLFALVDKQRRVRGIYDGLKEDEIQKLLTDIKSLLKEKAPKASFMNGFSNTPT